METDEIIIKFGHIFTTVSRSILNNYTSIGHVAEKYEIWIANFKLDAQTGHLLNTSRMSTRTSINFCFTCSDGSSAVTQAECLPEPVSTFVTCSDGSSARNTSRMSTRTSINFCYMLRRVICCQHKQNVHRLQQQHKQLRQQVQRIRLRFLFILLDQ